MYLVVKWFLEQALDSRTISAAEITRPLIPLNLESAAILSSSVQKDWSNCRTTPGYGQNAIKRKGPSVVRMRLELDLLRDILQKNLDSCPRNYVVNARGLKRKENRKHVDGPLA